MSRKIVSPWFSIVFASIALASLSGCAHTSTAMPSAPAAPAELDAASKADIDSATPMVTVKGIVDTVQVGDETITINFKNTQDSHFYAVILSRGRDAVTQALGGDVAKALTGKTVHIHGQVTLYRGRPEIVIDTPAQLMVDATMPS
jgi:DNA/RNA endonuclease YhcR with UshA esterase domain